MSDPVAALAGLEPLKVWSVLTTVFGDRAGRAGDALGGPELTALMGRIGIRAEATRVALHRLRKDGWIASERAGRYSLYTLTPRARSETGRVRAHVYDDVPPTVWALTVSQGALPADAIRLAPQTGLIPQGDGLPDALTAPIAATPPGWVEDVLAERGLGQLAERVADVLSKGPAPDDAARALALRILALHHWRRIALRPAARAHRDLFPNGAVARCGRAVHALLRAT